MARKKSTNRSSPEPRRRLPLVVLALILLVGAIAIPVALVSSRDEDEDERIGKQASESVRPGKSGKVMPLPTAQAADGLRHLLAREPDPEIVFDDFAKLARSLDEADLIALLDEIGMKRSDGYRAWIRSALYAEWASRDLEAALAYFRDHFENYRGILEQVPHALFVGSRPKDPWAALDYLRSLPDDPRFRLNYKLNGKRAPMIYLNRDWVKVSYQRLFTELAAQDPERAWRELPGRGEELGEPLNQNRILTTIHPYEGMVDGFFSGLTNGEAFAQFVERFGPVGEPGTEPIAIAIAKAWMNHDLAAAQAWAPPERHDPWAANLIYGVEGNAAGSWAKENPEMALQAIRDKVLPRWSYHMAKSLLEGNPHLAVELVEISEAIMAPPPFQMTVPTINKGGQVIHVTTPVSILPKEDAPPLVWNILRNSMRANSSWEGFPEPGLDNRPPDLRARYESYRAAIASDVFSEDERTKLRVHLDTLFEKHLNPPDEPPTN